MPTGYHAQGSWNQRWNRLRADATTGQGAKAMGSTESRKRRPRPEKARGR